MEWRAPAEELVADLARAYGTNNRSREASRREAVLSRHHKRHGDRGELRSMILRPYPARADARYRVDLRVGKCGTTTLGYLDVSLAA
jgi:hypothetical protein